MKGFIMIALVALIAVAIASRVGAVRGLVFGPTAT